jgi:hypothetical protein
MEGGVHMMKWIIGLLLAIVLSACRTTKYVPVETVRTVTEERTDTVELVKLVPYNNERQVAANDTSHLENDYATSEAYYDAGTNTLYHNLAIRPDATVEVPVTTIVRTITKTEPKIVEVEKKLTKKQEFLLNIAKISLVLNLCFFVILIVVYMGRKVKS